MIGRPRNLVLVGLSGTGKSRVGRLVAERLHWRFVDTDAEIERRAGRTVQEIFASDGEARFRALEREVVTRVARGAGAVIATGGGALLDEANRRALFNHNLVVCLRASPEAIAARLAHTRERRPLLEGGDLLSAVRTLAERRAPLYALAHETIDTEDRTLGEVANAVVEVFRRYV
ncbi:MAG TPA: shikimate kinase [Chloroflexota bacterium]|jgi:shikimate kinase|nr:shikimate kinase [Chloroflexota bacterium]